MLDEHIRDIFVLFVKIKISFVARPHPALYVPDMK